MAVLSPYTPRVLENSLMVCTLVLGSSNTPAPLLIHCGNRSRIVLRTLKFQQEAELCSGIWKHHILLMVMTRTKSISSALLGIWVKFLLRNYILAMDVLFPPTPTGPQKPV